MTRWQRFGRFNLVAALGAGVQLATLAGLVYGAGANYLVATAVGVGAAVAHNFAWHAGWTWKDRAAAESGLAATFARFALANGAVSLVGNTIVTAALVELGGLPPLPADGVAIAVCGLVNFELGDRLVFRPCGRGGRPAPNFGGVGPLLEGCGPGSHRNRSLRG